MGKIYVLRSSELTPRKGYREKGLFSDSPRGLSLFCVHTGIRGTTSPKSNSQATLRKGQQTPGNGLPSRVRKGWLFSPYELGRISQNTANQRGSKWQHAELKCQLPGKPGVSSRNKTPNKVLLLIGTFLILVEACFRPSERDAEATPKLNLVGYLLPEHTRATQSTKLTLQPHPLSSIRDWTHECFSGQRPGLPHIYS